MESLDGRRSSRALGTLIGLSVLAGLAVVSFARYDIACNSAQDVVESNQPLVLPVVHLQPCDDEEAIDVQIELDESVEELPALPRVYSI